MFQTFFQNHELSQNLKRTTIIFYKKLGPQGTNDYLQNVTRLL